MVPVARDVSGRFVGHASRTNLILGLGRYIHVLPERDTTNGVEWEMQKSELLLLPNLLSLSRIALVPFIGYFLWCGDNTSTGICLALFCVAGITDGLDGYFARRFRQVSDTGLILDPLADKVLASSVIVLLVLFRDFPIWLAAIILGRDLVILIISAFLLRGRQLALPSYLSGKYAFASIVALAAFHTIRFGFGIQLLTYVTLVLVAISTFSYTRRLLLLVGGRPLPVFQDRTAYVALRAILTAAVIFACTVKLYQEFLQR